MIAPLVNRLLPDGVALSLHGIGEPHAQVDADERGYWLTKSEFHRVVCETLEATEQLGLATAFTFDDANLSDFSEALPLLLERRLTGRFFVPVRRIGRPHYLSLAQLREIAASGMVVGSHGLHHVRWTELTDRDLRAETVDARRALEDMLGIEVVEAACPFGAVDRRVYRQLERTGFRRVFTSYMVTTRLNEPLVDRFSVTRGFDVRGDLLPRLAVARRCLDVVRRQRRRLRVVGLRPSR